MGAKRTCARKSPVESHLPGRQYQQVSEGSALEGSASKCLKVVPWKVVPSRHVSFPCILCFALRFSFLVVRNDAPPTTRPSTSSQCSRRRHNIAKRSVSQLSPNTENIRCTEIKELDASAKHEFRYLPMQ